VATRAAPCGSRSRRASSLVDEPAGQTGVRALARAACASAGFMPSSDTSSTPRTRPHASHRPVPLELLLSEQA
jgi:hypothetical protein